MLGAELRSPRPSSPPRMPKEIGCSNRMKWPRKRLGSGGSSGSPPHQEPQALPFAALPHMPPLTGDLLLDVVRHIPRAKAQGLDAWSPDDFKALPREAFDDLAEVLTQVEAEGRWPQGLTGAIVALLPKKDDHGPLAQRPISLLPTVYRLWAAARGAILKERFARESHASAWGQGKGKGADAAAWMAAAQAELAAAGGYDAFAAYIDCEKCCDHISLSDLAFQGCLQGISRLASLAAAQYTGQRYVRWAGALSKPVDPTHGIPAGCPLANGMLHLFLLRAMKSTEGPAQGAKLRTYADDWRLFAQGMRRKAAHDIVGGFAAATDGLRRSAMVVSLAKSVILAPGGSARAVLRQVVGAFGVQVSSGHSRKGSRRGRNTLAATRGTPAQKKRVRDAVASAARIARLPPRLERQGPPHGLPIREPIQVGGGNYRAPRPRGRQTEKCLP